MAQQIIAEFEHSPCAAGNLAAAPGVASCHPLTGKIDKAGVLSSQIPSGEEHEAQVSLSVHKEIFAWTIAAGGVGVMLRDLIIGDLHDVQVFFFTGDLVSPGSAGKGIHMAVSVARADFEIMVEHLVPHIVVMPGGSVLLIFFIPKKLIRPVDIFRQGIPFNLAFHAVILQTVPIDRAVQILYGLIRKPGNIFLYRLIAHIFIHIQHAANHFVVTIGPLVVKLGMLIRQSGPLFKQRHGLGLQAIIPRYTVKLGIRAQHLPQGASPAGKAVVIRVNPCPAHRTF